MAKKPKLPQNVELLQRRFDYAQQEFNAAYQERMQQYTGEISAFEGRIADYEQQAQAYLDDFDNYSQYLNSFFIAPGTNKPETFVKYGNNFYWAGDITPGFNLKAIEALPSLSGGEYQFVTTNQQAHNYSYQQYERVPKTVWETQSYTAYEMQLKPVTKYESVFVPAPLFSPPGTMGRFEYQMVTKNEFVSTPVTRTRQVMTTQFVNELVTRPASENIQIGYLKTQTPEGEFTTMRPEQFSVRSEPATFSAPAPEAPPPIDIADIRGELEAEKTYLQRESTEIRAASRRARMRTQARPLLSEGAAT